MVLFGPITPLNILHANTVELAVTHFDVIQVFEITLIVHLLFI